MQPGREVECWLEGPVHRKGGLEVLLLPVGRRKQQPCNYGWLMVCTLNCCGPQEVIFLFMHHFSHLKTKYLLYGMSVMIIKDNIHWGLTSGTASGAECEISPE